MINLIRGFKDILPGEVALWQSIQQRAVEVFEAFGYSEIRGPVLEKTELFSRSIGADTDIVEKEMYTFADRNGDLLTLRPEATASVVRAYIQHKLYASCPVRKFYSIGAMFRRERPQKGRYRQFYQINVEALGIESPFIDAQMIFMLHTLFTRLGVADTEAHINSLGCPACRPQYRRTLLAFIEGVADRLCADCRRRKERNPLRVLDCKVPACKAAVAQAPALADHLCAACYAHFAFVRRLLKSLQVPYLHARKMVRGLDYYTRTAFEMQTRALGAQSAVAGGGRYDGLVEKLGGPSTPAIGFAIGFDRLVEIVRQLEAPAAPRPLLYLAALGEQAREKAFMWLAVLGRRGVAVEMDYAGHSLKSQMKRADRLDAGHVLIVGATELSKGAAILRDMRTRQQTAIELDSLVETLSGMFRKVE